MTMKNGFSTINRLLGKHKESSSNLSRSSTNLSVNKSTVNINESSQVHQNRITPLPVATSNAPFEQTFRITVLLPRDQLYVARLGAKVLLHKLLQLVCENKQLDPEKYEFQHPADPSQIFSCDLTIGAVGLSEIRLCNKSEYNNNTYRTAPDDGTSRRNSFSSSKFSRNSKNISNTPSLYSSRNSLNSMSSSGIDSNFRQFPSEAGTPKHLAPVIPARKKRLAPRPPSQNLSIENDVTLRTKARSEFSLVTTENNHSQYGSPHSESNLDLTSEQRISETNDVNEGNLLTDCNGNTKGNLQKNGHCTVQCQETRSQAAETSVEVVPGEAFHSNSVDKNSTINQPEPSPRRRIQVLPKKLPVAPPRSTKSSTDKINEIQPEEESSDFSTLQVRPVALPRSISSGSLIAEPLEKLPGESPTPELNSPLQTPDRQSPAVETINSPSKESSILEDGEEHIDRSWNSSSTHSSDTKHKSLHESSSEDDEMIKVYNLKLGKTIVKTLSNHKTSENLEGIMPNNESEQNDQLNSSPAEDSIQSPDLNDDFGTPVADEIRTVDGPDHVDSLDESPQKELVICNKKEHQENPVIENEISQQIDEQELPKETNIKCENEVSQQIEEQIVTKELNVKSETHPQHSAAENAPTEEIEEVKINSESPLPKPQFESPPEKTTPSETKPLVIITDESKQSKVINTETTNNFSEATVKQEPLISTLERLVGDEELLDEIEPNFKASSIQTKPAIQTKPSIPTKSTLATRSSSFLSLAQLESNNQRNNYTTDEYVSRRRRSSSELSIGESPSLQSLGVIKSILSNSRKNSLCGTEESNRSSSIECDIQSMEEPSPKSNNILKRNNFKQADETEKVYRYSGPPNIHFSTWSDRPKVQVLIKNEKDCVFDGNGNGNGNGSKGGSDKQSTKSAVNKADFALHRSNQKFHTGRVSANILRSSNGNATLPETNSSEKDLRKEQSLSTTSTMPKFIVGARTSNQWPIGSTTSNTLPHNHRPLSQPPLYRSTSITRIISEPPVIKQAQPAFGQGTLRKTGFKEKIVPLQDTDSDVSKSLPFALKNQTNSQTTPKIAKNHTSIRTVTSPIPTVPEAPPPPIIRAVVTKQKSNHKTQISLTVDPRDQLLSAIRNFKRDELKNANI